MELIGYGDTSEIMKGNDRRKFSRKPLEVLKKLLPKSSTKQEPLFPFIGGAVGYVGYDSIRQYENIGEIPNDELQTPDVHFLFFEVLVVFDHLRTKGISSSISSKRWIISGRASSAIRLKQNMKSRMQHLMK